ncbi:MAG: metalloregulator ArsR/SmtB family transcription factor [Candidatus Krumholzibacteria bacterium]|nr:metalloregulator ArsR/SmtB family transcription factor [Candidatus Krumholzibacteria bacterium]
MKKQLPDMDNCARVASVLKAMANPHRLFILCRLYENEATVSELETLVGASQPMISQHLTRMRLEGLVDSRREGNYVYYSIVDPHVKVLIEALEKLYGLRAK